MKRSWSFLIVLALAALGGCGDDGESGDLRPGGDFVINPDLSPDVEEDADAVAGDADAAEEDAPEVITGPDVEVINDAQGPLVTVLSPEAAAGLGSDEILTSERFTARCRVTPNPDTGDLVLAESVRLDVTNGVNGLTAVGQPTQTPNEYTASFDVSGFRNGPLTVVCAATDDSEEAREAGASIDTYLDLGPTITVLSPTDNTSYARQVEVDVRVSAAPLAADDPGAEVGAVEVRVAGVALSELESPEPGRYRATVSFDAAQFNPPLEGENTVTVVARNQRDPAPVSRTREVVFVADSRGPSIVIEEPGPGALRGGLFTVRARIGDNAGINPSSVIATLAQQVQAPMRDVGEGVYEARFDSRELSRDWVFPLLEVRAQDSVGNQFARGFVIALDARPPVADFDPPRVREWKIDDGALQCSTLFDPVGDDAINDGESAPQLSKLRARIEDLGNGGLSADPGVLIPIAGVDAGGEGAPGTVQLFILDDEAGALVVDTDGDGVCDDINPLITPTSVPDSALEALVLDMQPIDPTGEAYFDPAIDPLSFGQSPSLISDAGCSPGEAIQAPDPVCDLVSEMTRVTHDFISQRAVIYSPAPVSEDRCLGNAVDSLASNVSDGWACVAVRALDTLGNVGVSRPIRVCFDADGDGSEGCGPWGTVETSGLPDCTGVYDETQNALVAGARCTPPLTYADVPGWQMIRAE